MKTPIDLANRKKDTSWVSTQRIDYGDDDSYEVPVVDQDGNRRASSSNLRHRIHTSEHRAGPVDPDAFRRLSLHNRSNRNDKG